MPKYLIISSYYLSIFSDVFIFYSRRMLMVSIGYYRRFDYPVINDLFVAI